MDSTTELLTADELATRLRVRPGTIRAWARRGLIPSVLISPKVRRFDVCAVIDAIKQSHGREVKDAR